MDMNIIVSIIVKMNLLEENVMLMELKISGVLQKEDYLNSTVVRPKLL